MTSLRHAFQAVALVCVKYGNMCALIMIQWRDTQTTGFASDDYLHVITSHDEWLEKAARKQ